MGEATGVEGRRRSGALVGSCKDIDSGTDGVTGTSGLEGMLGGELGVGWKGRGGDTAGVAAT